MDTYTEDDLAAASFRLLEDRFQDDPHGTLADARAWSRGSAMFLAHRLGPAVAYDIASKSADDIILDHAGELAVPIEAPPVGNTGWRDEVRPWVMPAIVAAAIFGVWFMR